MDIRGKILAESEHWQDYKGMLEIISSKLPGRCQRNRRTLCNWRRRQLIRSKRTPAGQILLYLPDVLDVLGIDGGVPCQKEG